MKKIEVIIKPSELDEVKAALDSACIHAITVSEVKSSGPNHSHSEIYRGTQFQVDFDSEVKIEMVIPDTQLQSAVAAIMKGAKPGEHRDEKIFVFNIENALRVNTARVPEHAV